MKTKRIDNKSKLKWNDFEDKVFQLGVSSKIKGWFRYVDDCFLIVSGNRETGETIRSEINKIKENVIIFTVEFEENHKINFLDLTVERKDDHLEFYIF